MANGQRLKIRGAIPADSSKPHSVAAIKHTLPQLTGRWAERKRLENDIEIPYSDSILLHFTTPGKALSKQGKTMLLSGDAVIEAGNILIVNGESFKIDKLNENELVLNNLEGLIHYFERTNYLSFEKQN